MSELVPLSEEIPDAARALATELRRFFRLLEISVRRYATRCNYDPATVSRYLNGKRVPPWSFIQGLLTEVAEHRGLPIQPGALEVIRKLHRSALQASNRHLYEVQILQDKLAEADKEHKLAELREKALLEAVHVREHRISKLELETLELNSSLLEERENSTNLQKRIDNAHSTEEELTKLKEEVRELKEQLDRAQELSEQAEARCEELEQKLREAEEAANSGREAREQENLESALREAAEAKSTVDRLREELEELRREKEAKSTSTPTPPEPAPKEPTQGDILIDSAQELSTNVLAAELVKLNFLDEIDEYRASTEISRVYPLAQLGELVLEIDKISNSIGRTFLLLICAQRPTEDIFTLIENYGPHTIADHSNFAENAVNWFTRRRTWAEIKSMAELLANAGLTELAKQCFLDTGAAQANHNFVETLRESSGIEREIVLQSMAQNRSDEKLLELLSELHRSDSPLLSTVMAAMEKVNAKRAKGLSRTLSTLGVSW